MNCWNPSFDGLRMRIDSVSSSCPTGPVEHALVAPDHFQRLCQMLDVGVAVHRRRRDAQALGAARHGRIVDRLDIDVVFGQKPVADALAGHRVSHHHRHDVAEIVHHRDSGPGQPAANLDDIGLMLEALRRAVLQVTDRGCGTGSHEGRQGGGEYEP